jgi:pSer/pThr/pTyr-binding forkhead associated (FHA) protein
MKNCSNGHQMEDSWAICPNCQNTGYAGTGLGKTRIENAPAASVAAPPSSIRKTVLLSQKYKAPIVGWLVALDGQQKGEDFRVRDCQNTIGSDANCDIVLTDSTISAKHASLRYKEGKFILTDLDSTNGSYLNEDRESIAREDLKDNDIVRFGDVRLKFKCL